MLCRCLGGNSIKLVCPDTVMPVRKPAPEKKSVYDSLPVFATPVLSFPVYKPSEVRYSFVPDVNLQASFDSVVVESKPKRVTKTRSQASSMNSLETSEAESMVTSARTSVSTTTNVESVRSSLRSSVSTNKSMSVVAPVVEIATEHSDVLPTKRKSEEFVEQDAPKKKAPAKTKKSNKRKSSESSIVSSNSIVSSSSQMIVEEIDVAPKRVTRSQVHAVRVPSVSSSRTTRSQISHVENQDLAEVDQVVAPVEPVTVVQEVHQVPIKVYCFKLLILSSEYCSFT